MSIFNSSTVLQCFMICFTINIVRADESDEYHKCLRQIHMAFGYNSTATGCLKYAMQFYIKGEDIPKKAQRTHNRSQKVAESTVQVHNFDDLMSSRKRKGSPIKVESFEELISGSQNDRQTDVNNVGGPIMASGQADSWNQQQNVEDIIPNVQADATNYAKLYHKELEYMLQGSGVPVPYEYCSETFKDFYHSCMESLKAFGDTSIMAVRTAFSKYKLKHCFHDIFLYHYMEMIINQCKAGHDFSQCMIEIHYAFGKNTTATGCLRYAIEHYVITNCVLIFLVRGQYIPVKDENIPITPIKVDSFEELMKSEQSENKNTSNYAMQYYDELEKMVRGAGVPSPNEFCEKYFILRLEGCKNAMKPFGKTPKSAVKRAFLDYKLAQLPKGSYIYKYMGIMIERCTTFHPSKRPVLFCKKIVLEKKSEKK